MKWTLPLLLCIPIMLMFSCKSQEYSPETYEKDQVMFGSGGGMTGAATTYSLLQNGKLYVKKSSETQFTLKTKVPKSAAKAIFKQIEEGGMSSMSLNSPSNMYSFIEVMGDTGKNRMVWKKGDDSVDDKVKNVYQAMMKLVSSGM